MNKDLLGIAGAVISIVSYLPYIRDVAQRRTVPHVFSWLTWASMTAISFGGQLAGGGGWGILVNGVTSLFCLGIFVAAVFVGDRSLTRLDTLSMGGAVLAALAWPLANGPLVPVVIVTAIDVLGGYVPTFRKCYWRPYTETLSNYVLSAVKFGLAAGAMGEFNLVTGLFPVTLFIVDVAFIVMVLVRRGRGRPG